MQPVTSKKEFLEYLDSILSDNIMINAQEIEIINDTLSEIHPDWRVVRPRRETEFRITINCMNINEV